MDLNLSVRHSGVEVNSHTQGHCERPHSSHHVSHHQGRLGEVLVRGRTSWRSGDDRSNIIFGTVFLIGTLLVLVLSLAVVVVVVGVDRSLAGSGLNPFNHTTVLHLQSAIPVHLSEIERETSTRFSQCHFVVVFATQQLHREGSELRLNVADLVDHRLDCGVLFQQHLCDEVLVRQCFFAQIKMCQMTCLLEGRWNLGKIRKQLVEHLIDRKMFITKLQVIILCLASVLVVELFQMLRQIGDGLVLL
mmetsp:Transcript_34218/g.58820  ORF Transcript_34218/g.58820 Transcript_34218/m.58820 type:complete len:247 (-) Transcript_34218:327-1067(-)